MTDWTGLPFPPEVVAQIARHMNGDHADDNVLIVRGWAGSPRPSAARMSGMDADGMDFEATVDGIAVPVRIPFARAPHRAPPGARRGRPHVPGGLRGPRASNPATDQRASRTDRGTPGIGQDARHRP